jgi:hypothetical protein
MFARITWTKLEIARSRSAVTISVAATPVLESDCQLHKEESIPRADEINSNEKNDWPSNQGWKGLFQGFGWHKA